jgi:hypothetical protein
VDSVGRKCNATTSDVASSIAPSSVSAGPRHSRHGKEAAVELEQLPGRGLARASGPMLGGPAPMDGGPPERQAQAAHRFARDGELVDLAQLLGQMCIVEARVAIAEEGLHLRRQRHREAAGERPPTILMS